LLPYSSESFVFVSAVQKAKIKMYKITILHVVLCGCETSALILRESHRCRMFKSGVLRILGCKRGELTGGWSKLLYEERHCLCSSPNTFRIVAGMREMRNEHDRF